MTHANDYIVSTWPDGRGVLHIAIVNTPPPPGAVIWLELRHGVRWEPVQLIAACQMLALADHVVVVGDHSSLVRQTLVALSCYGINARTWSKKLPTGMTRIRTSGETPRALPEVAMNRCDAFTETEITLDTKRILIDLDDSVLITAPNLERLIRITTASSLPVLVVRGKFDLRTDVVAYLAAEGVEVDADPRRTLGSLPQAFPRPEEVE